eukprot:Phypoly_transcript_28612.p1 GENE.Phypoly_transcript_28612~~Phypoly_transcript_28612.p1  ORF type:complete len:121 (+),score=17.80 Phypoly_transcript_28612:40-363(+)
MTLALGITPKSAYVFRDAESRAPATFAKVEFFNSNDAKAAIERSGTFKAAGKVVQISEHQTAEQRDRQGKAKAPGRYSGARNRAQYRENGRGGRQTGYIPRIEAGRR